MRYIGVAGVTQVRHVERLITSLPSQHVLGNTILKVGIRVSRETLEGHEPKKGGYPAAHVLPELIIPDPRVHYILHVHAEERHVLQCIERGWRRTEGKVHGIQINAIWPEWDLVRDCRAALPAEHNTIILRVGRDAFEVARNDPAKVARRVQAYAGYIDYCLLHHKQSMGGHMSSSHVLQYLAAIAGKTRNVDLAVGGGISAETAPRLLKPLFKQFPELSVDAELGLMTPTLGFDTEHACAYVRAVCDLHHPAATP